MRGQESTASLVIAESGAPWPRFAQELQRRAAHAVVESQPGSESLDAFVQRVTRRLSKLDRAGLTLDVAVLATNDRTDVAALDARRRLARAVLSAMRERVGELIISASEDVSDQARHHLFALAGTLVDELAGSAVGVRVRFTSASHSAVRAVRPSDPEIAAGGTA